MRGRKSSVKHCQSCLDQGGMEGRTLKSNAFVRVYFSSMRVRLLFAAIVRYFVAIIVVASRLSFENVSAIACVLDFLSQPFSWVPAYLIPSVPKSVPAYMVPDHSCWLVSRDERDLRPFLAYFHDSKYHRWAGQRELCGVEKCQDRSSTAHKSILMGNSYVLSLGAKLS